MKAVIWSPQTRELEQRRFERVEGEESSGIVRVPSSGALWTWTRRFLWARSRVGRIKTIFEYLGE